MSALPTCYMERAFELGREALACGEVPVGCVLYLPGKNLSRYRILINELNSGS